MIKSNYFILTGAMGGGKSTILAKLAESGVYCVPEPARAILAEQRMISSAGVPEINKVLATAFLRFPDSPLKRRLNLSWKEFEGENQKLYIETWR